VSKYRPPKPSVRLESSTPLLFVLIPLFALYTGCGGTEAKSASQKGPPPPPVVVATVTQQPVPLEIRAIGNVEAWSAVEIKSQVAGQLASVNFQEGDDVRQGQVLFQIDPREFQQAVQEAEAQVASQQAALGQAEANYQRDLAQARNADAQAKRYSDLTAKGIVSREQNDQLQTQATAAGKAANATKAAIESARAAIQGAEARLADAKLKLSYTRITAPISGRTGSLQFKEGNLVTANAATPLVIINQISPVYATFSIPEQTLDQLRSYAAAGKLNVAALPAQAAGEPEIGVLDFLDNKVDQQTGTIRMKARFPNNDRRLWPGQFVNVAVRLSSPIETVVPMAAVRTAQVGSYVFVVKADGTAEQRTVETPRSYRDFAVIARGLNQGERVIVEGQLRVKPGTKVQIVERGQGSGTSAPAGQ
jgi:multidrug efflux system membrane fusion protein